MNTYVSADECNMPLLALSLTLAGDSADLHIYKLRFTRAADLRYNERYL